MKKLNLLSCILVLILIASVVVFTKAICEDEDSVSDILCDASDYLRYKELFANILANPGFFYEYPDCVISHKSIMAYLERQEKSPPTSSSIFVIA